jgi:hypothetical protein
VDALRKQIVSSTRVDAAHPSDHRRGGTDPSPQRAEAAMAALSHAGRRYRPVPVPDDPVHRSCPSTAPRRSPAAAARRCAPRHGARSEERCYIIEKALRAWVVLGVQSIEAFTNDQHLSAVDTAGAFKEAQELFQ